jgi:HlyD family type I secretion membrane fusion protein
MKIVKQKLSDPVANVRHLLFTATAVIGVLFFGIGGWAATARLSSAAIAAGQVVVSSTRQTVQHLEGGIISEIAVRDGDYVESGQVLVRLEGTRAGASYDLLLGQFLAALGEKSRLEAERDALAEITWDKQLLADPDNVKAREIIRGQTNVFQTRRDYMFGQQRLVAERKLQIQKEIEGLRAQANADDEQLALLNEERAGVKSLLDKGLEKRPRLLALDRTRASIQGERGDLEARIARAQQSISELNAQLNDLKNRMMTEVVTQLRDSEKMIADLDQRLRAAKDISDRLEIRAPRSGYVVNMAFHTVGGVIDSGRPILDIVPDNDTLLVEARFSIKDIDVLKVGLPAQITLDAYSARTVPPMAGSLVMVSADRLTDPATGEIYYLGRVEVSPEGNDLLDDVKLVPGMQAQVMVYTGERTALDYLFDPFERSINRAFRES